MPRGADSRRRGPLIAVIAILAAAGIAVGLYLFQPWRIFTSSTLSEALPSATSSPTPSMTGALPTTSATATPLAAETPRVLARGTLISHEHVSSGTALLLELPDGQRVLRFEGLDTSDGPDLRVWLSDAPVIEGPAGWHVFDDGRYLDLGPLKANKGEQNYTVPTDADLSDYGSVSIWCARFAVSFTAAELRG